VVMGAAATPASCSTGTQVYAGTALSATATGLTNGTTYGFRVCALDGASNWSAGATATARPIPETAAPTAGKLTLNGGASVTALSTVTAALAATDASGVAQVCLSNTATCTAWQAFKPSLSWPLSAGDGPKTVSAWFADIWGNQTLAPVTATIRLDSTAPADGKLTAAGAAGSIKLSWSGFSDAGSGVAGYKVLALSGAGAPSLNCTTGTALYSGPAASTVHAGLTAGQKYTYRVCAIDAAGNVSAGAIATATAQ
jgi:hypothetical protein